MPAGVDTGAELLVEECVLEIVGEEAAGVTTSRWRSYQVEGPKAEVRGAGLTRPDVHDAFI